MVAMVVMDKQIRLLMSAQTLDSFAAQGVTITPAWMPMEGRWTLPMEGARLLMTAKLCAGGGEPLPLLPPGIDSNIKNEDTQTGKKACSTVRRLQAKNSFLA